MTGLERQQRGLLDLIKGRSTPVDDPYLRRVTGSPGLAVVREIALWWRAFELETQCRLTSRLLKRFGCFDAHVIAYFGGASTSPFIEELSRGFLQRLHDHDDPLIAAVSRFEGALLAIRAGSSTEFEILWDRHPEFVLTAIETGGELPASELGRVYRMRVGRDVPELVTCTREWPLPTAGGS